MKYRLLKFKKYFFTLVFFLAGYSSFSQLTLEEWNFPSNPDNAIVDVSIPPNAAQTIITVGGTSAISYGVNTGATTWCAWCTNWTGGSGIKWWEIQVNTTGYFNLELSSKQTSSNTGPRDWKAQYKIGAAG